MSREDISDILQRIAVLETEIKTFKVAFTWGGGIISGLIIAGFTIIVNLLRK